MPRFKECAGSCSFDALLAILFGFLFMDRSLGIYAWFSRLGDGAKLCFGLGLFGSLRTLSRTGNLEVSFMTIDIIVLV